MLIIIKISLIIVAIYALCSDGMLLNPLIDRLDNGLQKHLSKWADYIRKPLYGCLTCMASFWGLVFCLIFKVPLVEIPQTIFLVCGFNFLIDNLIANARS